MKSMLGAMTTSRRKFMASCGALGTTAWLAPAMGMQRQADVRKYNLSITPQTPEPDPEMIEAIRRAGVSDVWITCSCYGEWRYPADRMKAWRSRIEAAGMRASFLNVPLGHPGCTTPKSWRAAVSADGKSLTGTSLHDPATKANCDALRQMDAMGVKRVFLDDDFRLAQSPGDIGGCFCPEHKQAFLRRFGYGEQQASHLRTNYHDRTTHVPTHRDGRNIVSGFVDTWLSIASRGSRRSYCAGPIAM